MLVRQTQGLACRAARIVLYPLPHHFVRLPQKRSYQKETTSVCGLEHTGVIGRVGRVVAALEHPAKHCGMLAAGCLSKEKRKQLNKYSV